MAKSINHAIVTTKSRIVDNISAHFSKPTTSQNTKYLIKMCQCLLNNNTMRKEYSTSGNICLRFNFDDNENSEIILLAII